MSDWPVVSDLLQDIRDDIDLELDSNPEVKEADPDDLDAYDLPMKEREWLRLEDVVAVVVDLKGSTKLGTGKHAASTAAIYEAATDNAVKVLHDYKADFIQIQGDGAFGLFWGDLRYERAMCAGITVKTFSRDLVAKIDKKWPDSELETGYKVGVANGRVLVKQIGTPRNPDEQEPVWAGKPVNYAAKAAQTAGVDDLIVTGSVWDYIEDNDFLTVSCGHKEGGEKGDPSAELWGNVEIENVPEEDDERYGHVLDSGWCGECGDAFSAAILEGETDRDDADDARAAVLQKVREGKWGAALKARGQRTRSWNKGVRRVQ